MNRSAKRAGRAWLLAAICLVVTGVGPAPAWDRGNVETFAVLPEGATGDDLRQFLVGASADFRDKAPVSAAQAATIILDGVRAGSWRILIGEDARMIDAAVRAKPEAAYDYAELFAGLIPDGGDQAG